MVLCLALRGDPTKVSVLISANFPRMYLNPRGRRAADRTQLSLTKSVFLFTSGTSLHFGQWPRKQIPFPLTKNHRRSH